MIQYLKTMQEKNVIERREHLAKIIYQQDPDKAVEIEENFMGKKVKTMTAYFGDLVADSTTSDQNNNANNMEQQDEFEE